MLIASACWTFTTHTPSFQTRTHNTPIAVFKPDWRRWLLIFFRVIPAFDIVAQVICFIRSVFHSITSLFLCAVSMFLSVKTAEEDGVVSSDLISSLILICHSSTSSNVILAIVRRTGDKTGSYGARCSITISCCCCCCWCSICHCIPTTQSYSPIFFRGSLHQAHAAPRTNGRKEGRGNGRTDERTKGLIDGWIKDRRGGRGRAGDWRVDGREGRRFPPLGVVWFMYEVGHSFAAPNTSSSGRLRRQSIFRRWGCWAEAGGGGGGGREKILFCCELFIPPREFYALIT